MKKLIGFVGLLVSIVVVGGVLVSFFNESSQEEEIIRIDQQLVALDNITPENLYKREKDNLLKKREKTEVTLRLIRESFLRNVLRDVWGVFTAVFVK